MKSCVTLWNPLDCSLPGSPVCGFLQARISERVTISFSRGSSRPRDRTWVSGIGRWILYHWATREAQLGLYMTTNGHLLTRGALPHASKSSISCFDISDILLPYFSDIFIHKVKFSWILMMHRASLVAQLIQNPTAIQETWVQVLGQGDPLEKELATHSSNLAWEIPWTEESGGLQSMGLKESDTT